MKICNFFIFKPILDMHQHPSKNNIKYDETNQFFCPNCSKSFKYQRNLTRHIRDKTCLKCRLCKKSFDNKVLLEEHSNTHFENIHKNQEFKEDDTNANDDTDVEEPFVERTGFEEKLHESVFKVSGYRDPYKCFQRYRPRLKRILFESLKKSSIKFFVTMKVRMFKKGVDGSREYDVVGFYGGTYHCLTETEVDDCLDQTSQMLNSNFETFSTNGSGWILEKVEKITLKVAKKVLDKKGGSYIETPKSIKSKNAVINVQNKDLKCFEYSILAALHHKELQNPIRVSSYNKWVNKEFDMTEFPQPMHPKMIHKFEKKYSLSINLYHIESEGNMVTPFLISKKRLSNPINLLLIEDTKRKSHHYVYIKSFSRLMNQGKEEKGSKYCPYCLHKFSRSKSTAKFEEHKENCGSYEPARVIMPNEQEKWIKFKNFKYLDKHPVVIYADFESYNVPIKDESVNNKILVNDKKSYTKKISKQDCSGYSFTIVSPYYDGKKIFTYRGKNPVIHFLKSLEKEQKKIRKWFYQNEFKFVKLNSKENLDFLESKVCYLCKDEIYPREDIDKFIAPIQNNLKECVLENHKFPTSLEMNKARKFWKIRLKEQNITDETKTILKNRLESLKIIEDYLKTIQPAMLRGHKVADHDHFEGTFRGAAHNVCNLSRRKFSKIPCFFHNFTGYDCHLIVKHLAGSGYKPKVIAKAMEKYLYLGINCIDFKDSLQFLPNSLEQLTKNLREKNGKNYEKFPHLWAYFKKNWGHLHESNFDLITRKLYYPYSYISSEAIFLEENPPDITKFKSDLANQELTAKQYDSFLQVWNTFGLKNIGELHDLYVEVDVLLLADCFEKFRTFSLKNYKLDPVHFMTAPALSWDSALLHTEVKLEIPTDPDIHIFIDKGIRGGISFVGNPHAKAHNKYITKTNKSDEKDYIMFFDVNNQYGAAMSEYLPTDGFKWDLSFNNMSVHEQTEFILGLKDDDPTGYIFSCDIEYPHNLHDLHDEFPMCPENLSIKDEWLSPYQMEMKKNFQIKGVSKKLCLTLFDKKDYILHYRNLKYCLTKGLKIKRVNKVLKFNQSPWLRSYIELNTKLRQEAESKFEESFPKLMNNSFFGKTCQNKRKYTNIKIATKSSEAERLIASPRMMRWKLIDEELGMFDMGQHSIKLDKPRYIGLCVLELSKLIMYKFHYDYILPQFPKTKLLFTDTDSFCYHIKTKQDVYEVIKGNSTWFDFSNYPANHTNFDNKINHLKPGVFKDETGSIPIQEFVGLRSKMYSVHTNEGNGKRTAKGILRSQQKKMHHADYQKSLFQTESSTFIGKKIMQKEHGLYIAEIKKKGLCPYNDKKHIKRDNDIFETKSFGHYSLY